MATIFLGKSTCPICKNILEEGQIVEAFPPLTTNKKDAFYLFSDAGFHSKCLDNHPISAKIRTYTEKTYEKTNTGNRFCVIAKTPIIKPENFFFIGLLTSDETEPLSKFNCLLFDKENLKNWEQKEEFLSLAKAFLEEGKWESFSNFNYLQWIINEIENT